MMMVAPPPPPTKPTPKQPTQSGPLATLAYLEEFISAMDDRLDNRTPILAAHRLPMSFHDMHVLQANAMDKLIDMIGDLNRKIALLTIATICPPKSPLDYTTNALMIPIPRPML